VRDSSGNPFLWNWCGKKIVADSPTRAVAIDVGEGHAQMMITVNRKLQPNFLSLRHYFSHLKRL